MILQYVTTVTIAFILTVSQRFTTLNTSFTKNPVLAGFALTVNLKDKLLVYKFA